MHNILITINIQQSNIVKIRNNLLDYKILINIHPPSSFTVIVF